ncbi:MAG: PEGA domain-containing protein [Pseudomonadales bacterium]|nr:PEGA domain-containing protein [Pseudomonadales bacterium]
MRRWYLTFLLTFPLIPSAIAGCATVQRGPTETFVVRSTPSGAEVSSTSGWECTTPCTVTVARRGDFVVTVRKEGYVTQTLSVKSVPVQKKQRTLGDRVQIPTGLIGKATDMASGANLEHQPNPLEVELEQETLNPAFD